MASKVLLIVEGEKKDVRLMERLFNVFLPDSSKEIIPYKTNLYELYNQMTKTYAGELENVDLMMFMRSREKDVEKKEIFDARYYSDIILIFDFDPQDKLYSADTLQNMMRYFNNSTENGRLYINYPMVESFCHIKDWQEDVVTYNMRYVSREDLIAGKYKSIVNSESCCTDIRKYDREKIEKVIELNLKKILYLLNMAIGGRLVCDAKILTKVMKKEVAIWNDENRVAILNTCILYIYEFNTNIL